MIKRKVLAMQMCCRITRDMFCQILVAAALALPFVAVAGVVLPENTDEILVNPDMGLVMFHYSNRDRKSVV